MCYHNCSQGSVVRPRQETSSRLSLRLPPGSRISLFGYSEGAWIINVWELKHPAEAGPPPRLRDFHDAERPVVPALAHPGG